MPAKPRILVAEDDQGIATSSAPAWNWPATMSILPEPDARPSTGFGNCVPTP
jgi:hypothetical protein